MLQKLILMLLIRSLVVVVQFQNDPFIPPLPIQRNIPFTKNKYIISKMYFSYNSPQTDVYEHSEVD